MLIVSTCVHNCSLISYIPPPSILWGQLWKADEVPRSSNSLWVRFYIQLDLFCGGGCSDCDTLTACGLLLGCLVFGNWSRSPSVWETVISNHCPVFPCFNVILMTEACRCNYLANGPQVCSWVLDCHIGPHLDDWQMASHGILVLYFMVNSLVVSSWACCWTSSILHCHSGANCL